MDDIITPDTKQGSVRIVPGTAVAVVGGRVAALVVDDPRSDLVKRLHARISAGATLDELVEVLVAEGVRRLPSFGLVSWTGDEARLIVRGDVGALLQPISTGPVSSVAAGGVTTWVERVEPRVGTVQLHLLGDLSELGPFETRGGLLPACRIEVRCPGGGDATEGPEPSVDDRGQADRPGADAASSSVPSDPPEPPALPEAPEPPALPEAPEPPALPESAEVEGQAAGEWDESAEGNVSDGGSEEPESARFGPASPIMESDNDAAVAGEPPRSGPSPLDTLIGPFDLDPDQDDGDDESSVPEVLGDGGDAPVDAADDYDHLFGATQFRTVEDAAVRSPDLVDDSRSGPGSLISSIPGGDPAGPSPSLADIGPGDHDGHTISLSALQAARARVGLDSPPSTRAGAALPAPPAGAPMVHAVRCRGGHLNPPHATNCRVCDALIGTQEHVTVPRPVLGVLRFSDGRTLFLSGPMLIGRSPRAEGAVGGEPPELVAVASPLKEISGTHLEVRIEGWQVFLVDRQSTNGTVATLPGRDAQRLHPGEPFLITPGTSVSLADEIEFRFEASV